MIGQSLLEGKQLYRDLWDNKPPGIFYLYAVIARLFGHVMWSVAVVDILWLFVISYCIFRFAERYLGSTAAALAVMIHASWRVQAGYIYSAQPESFQVLCVFLACFLLQRRETKPKCAAAISGILLATAFWLKYNAIAFLPFFLLVPYLDLDALDSKPRRALLALPRRAWFAEVGVFMAGFVGAVVIVLAYFWAVGAWPAMREIQFEVLPSYARMAVASRPAYWLYAILVTRYWIGTATEVAVIAGLVIAWRRRELARFAPVFLAAVSAYASTALQVRFHDYYFQVCFPFFAMIWGYVAVKIFEGFRAAARDCLRRGWRVAAVLVWLVLANLAYWPLPSEVSNLSIEYRFLNEWRRDHDNFYADYPWQLWIEHLRGQLSVVRYLKQNSAPGDGVYVWSANALIYYLSDRRPPTRFVSNLGLMSAWTPPAWREELVRDLEKVPPRFIVVARRDSLPMITYTRLDSRDYMLQSFPGLASFIANRYQLAADFSSFLVYRRAL